MIVPNPDVPGGEQVKILDFGIAEVRLDMGDGKSPSVSLGGKDAEQPQR